MEVGKTKPVRCERINVWCLDGRSEAAEVGEAKVIEEHDDNIGRILSWVLSGWPPGLGVSK
ncbi:unannotated protein [freshwater metagenome]|uniref:Unannotated protein n=1 Tax=freshwater metagenome TaxID=449393 RepID=A0A6J7JYJ0_9ZZZZ